MPKPAREQQRRERFKLSVYAALGGLGLLLAGLLIQGCHSQKRAEIDTGATADAATNEILAPTNSLAASAVLPETNAVAQASAPPALTATAPLAVATNAVPVAVGTNSSLPAVSAAPAPAPATNRYVVKKGDTLLHIARTHHTTVQAIKLANGLTTDRILAGKELKLPAATAAKES